MLKILGTVSFLNDILPSVTITNSKKDVSQRGLAAAEVRD